MGVSVFDYEDAFELLRRRLIWKGTKYHTLNDTLVCQKVVTLLQDQQRNNLVRLTQ